MAGVGLLFALFALGMFALWVWALVDILRTPDDVWSSSSQDRLVWALVVVFLNALGAILYLVIARPELQRLGAGSSRV